MLLISLFNALRLTAEIFGSGTGVGAPVASRYGWGAVPMLSVYDKHTGLPLLPWSQRVATEGVVASEGPVEGSVLVEASAPAVAT